MRRFTPGVSSMPSGRYSSPNVETTHNIWGPTTPLKPSVSIWGFNAMPYVHQDYAAQEWEQTPTTDFYPAYPSVPMHNSSGGIAIECQNQQRQSVPSLPSSISSNSSQYWNDDFLFTPPLSPSYGNQASMPPSNGDYPPSFVSPASTPGFEPEPVFRESEQDIIDCPELIKQGSKETSLSPSPSSEKLVISCSTGPLYVVQFKGNRRDIYTAPGTNSYSPGDAIMVDADRGRDLGVIIQANISRHDAASLKQMQHNSRQHILQSTNHTNEPSLSPELAAGPSVYTPKQILSKASSSEIKDLASKIEDENAAVEFCNKKVAERMLDMVIVDAEYQWDRKKLTFFYTANNRVDFRSLVRELFRIYKTRIWMCATTVCT